MRSLVNPATGKKIGGISAATDKDVDLAVKAAQKAFETSWGLKTSGTERGKLMLKLATLIEEHADELAAIETLNAGKRPRFALARTECLPFWEYVGVTLFFARFISVRIAAEVLRYYSGWADKIHGKTIEGAVGHLLFRRC